MNKYDVCIVGGGPAGATAAYILAKSGFKTAVLDKSNFPRPKICGGGVTKRALQYLPFNTNGLDFNPIKELIFSEEDSKIELKVEREEPFIFLTNRSEFDYFLLRKALEKGAVLFEDFDVSEKNGKVIKSKDKKEITAEVFIWADGANGYSNKKRRQNFLFKPSVQAEIPSRLLKSNSTDLKTRFHFGFPANGYSWIFNKKEIVSIGLTGGGKVNLKKGLKIFAERFGIEINSLNVKGYFVPLLKKNIIPFEKNGLFVGDALGIADPLTLEGISMAILSGKIAAESIVRSELRLTVMRKLYKEEIEKKIYKELKYSRFVANLVFQHPRLRTFLMRKYGSRLANKMVEVIWGNTQYSKEFTDIVNFAKLFKYL